MFKNIPEWLQFIMKVIGVLAIFSGLATFIVITKYIVRCDYNTYISVIMWLLLIAGNFIAHTVIFILTFGQTD